MMLDWLFPNWTNPLHLVVLLALRFGANLVLTFNVQKSLGKHSAAGVASLVGTIFSLILSILLLRESGLGLTVSYIEFAIQVIILLIAGYAAYSSSTRWVKVVIAIVGAIATVLLLVMIPIYGEALVAP